MCALISFTQIVIKYLLTEQIILTTKIYLILIYVRQFVTIKGLLIERGVHLTVHIKFSTLAPYKYIFSSVANIIRQ